MTFSWFGWKVFVWLRVCQDSRDFLVPTRTNCVGAKYAIFVFQCLLLLLIARSWVLFCSLPGAPGAIPCGSWVFKNLLDQ